MVSFKKTRREGYRELLKSGNYFYEYQGKKVKPSIETFVKSLQLAEKEGGDPYVVRGGKKLFLDNDSPSKYKRKINRTKKTTAKKTTSKKTTSCAKKVAAIRKILK
jgi:hypothetical protein